VPLSRHLHCCARDTGRFINHPHPSPIRFLVFIAAPALTHPPTPHFRQAYPALRASGITLVATSNCEPDALYRAGLNRQVHQPPCGIRSIQLATSPPHLLTSLQVLFAPFVTELCATCDVVSLAAGVDYRHSPQPPLQCLYAHGTSASRSLSRTFAALAAAQPAPAHIPVPGASRSVSVPVAAGRVCRFSFEEICGAALSAADYLALCTEYDAFVVEDVPAGGIFLQRVMCCAAFVCVQQLVRRAVCVRFDSSSREIE
jgi:predicted ATPase